jgi:serine/threonine protein kinase
VTRRYGVAFDGLVAGKYRVQRVLGEGGMGLVVAAHHEVLDRLVALKLLPSDSAKDAVLVTRFLREARAAAGLKSEHVARVLDVGTLEGGAPFLVMEYLEGADLARVLAAGGALPVEVACDYVVQA